MDQNYYPITKDYVRMHLIPGGAFILKKTGSKDPMWRWILDEVDEITREIILLCNGTNNIKEIEDNLKNKGLGNSANPQSIIEVLEWQGVIELMPDPKKRKILITGSEEIFSPLHLYLETTDQCNFSCKHCYRESSPSRKSFIDVNGFFDFITQLVEFGMNTVEITGGEPLLHPQIREILNMTTELCDVVSLLSNGYLINKRFIKQIENSINSKKLIASITINSSYPEFHDKFTGIPGSWGKATHGLRLLAEVGVPVRYAMNIVPENIDDLERSLLLAKSLGAKIFAASPVLPFGRGAEIDFSPITTEKMMTFEKEYALLSSKYPTFIMKIPDEIREKLLTGHCGAGVRTFAISPEGDVRPCPNVSVDLMKIGNIFAQPLDVIFSSPIIYALQKVRAPGPATCSGCTLEAFCQLCWYRGLIGSQYVNDCNWLAKTNLPCFLDLERLNETARNCNLSIPFGIR